MNGWERPPEYDDPPEPTDNQEIEAGELAVRGLHTCAVCRMPTAPENRSVCYKCYPEKEEQAREELSRAVAELREARAERDRMKRELDAAAVAVRETTILSVVPPDPLSNDATVSFAEIIRGAAAEIARGRRHFEDEFRRGTKLTESVVKIGEQCERLINENARLRAALELLAQVRHISGSAQAHMRHQLKIIDAVLEKGLDVRKDGALEGV